MAAAKSGSAGSSSDRRIAKGLKVGAVVLVSLLALGACVAAVANTDSSTAVDSPDATERRETVEVLRRSAAAQNVCYGWRLTEYWRSAVVSEGSNLGDGVAVDSDPVSCPRWLQVNVEVRYMSESSESEDRAIVRVTESPGFSTGVTTAGLARLGLDEGVYLDDPGWAVCRAAVFLPLLLAEAGAVPPAPVATAMPTAQAAPLPAAGNDLWRDRWGFLVAGVALLLLTALLLAIGWFERRHQRRRISGPARPDRAATQPPSPAPR